MASQGATPFRLVILGMMVIAFVTGCRGERSPSDDLPDTGLIDTARVDTARGDFVPDDRDNRAVMLMIEEIPLGVTYSDVARRISGLGELKPELGGIAEELEEARAELTVMGRDAIAEFNFRNDTLYSYYFHVDAASCTDADSLYSDIIEFYRDAFGQPQTEAEDEGGYAWESASWPLPPDIRASKVAATLGRHGEACRVGWGYD